MFEQSPFDGCPAGCGEAADSAVTAQDAVARDDQRDRIPCQRAANCSGGAWFTYSISQLAVRDLAATTDPPAGGQDQSVERTAAVERNGRISTEIHVFAVEISNDPPLEIHQQAPLESHFVQASQQRRLHHDTVAGWKAGSSDRITGRDQTERPPAGLQNRVS